MDVPLGHDESVYALRTRYFVGGGFNGGYWNDYRAPGLSLIMSVFWWAGGSDASLRLVVVALAAAGIVLLWAWARSMLDARAALLAATLLALAPGYLRYAWQIALDIPSSSLSLAAILVFSLASRGERIRPWALWAIPFAAAAAAVRYGGPLQIGAGMTAVALAHWRAVRRSLGLIVLLAAGTLAIMGVILYVPAVTGSDRSPILAFQARQVAKELSFWNSYIDFAAVAPGLLGWIVGIAVVIGVPLACIGAARRKIPREPVVMGLGAAILFFVLLNYGLAEGFAQYLTPLLPFVMLATAAGLAPLLRRLGAVPALIAAGTFVVLGGWIAFDDATGAAASFQQRFGPLRAAAIRIDEITVPECAVLTTYGPQVGWYSRCDARSTPRVAPDDVTGFRSRLATTLSTSYVGISDDAQVLSLLVSQGKRQPNGDTLRFLKSLSVDPAFTVGEPDGPPRGYVEVDLLGPMGDLRAALSVDPDPG